MRDQIRWVMLLPLSMLITSVSGEPCMDGEGPEAAVRSYLTAMQEHRFNDAYAFVTAKMTDGKVEGEWAALQKLFYQGGEVNLLSMDIRDALVVDGESDCSTTALVPNVLVSKDKFNNQGTTEFELYTTRKVDGSWRVDMQETLFEQSEVDQWFPGETMPEFRDQY